MMGLVLAVLIGGLIYLFGDVLPEEAFLSGTNFLFWWYLVLGIIGLLIISALVLGLMGVGALAGGSIFGVVGGILGVAGGGAFGLYVIATLVVVSGMRIVGAYVLHDSVALVDDAYVWEVPKVVVGALFVGIPVLLRRKSKQSPSPPGSSLSSSSFIDNPPLRSRRTILERSTTRRRRRQ